MRKNKIISFSLVILLLMLVNTGCIGKQKPQSDVNSGWANGSGVEPDVTEPDNDSQGSSSGIDAPVLPPESEDVDKDFKDKFEVDTEDYAKVDMTLGRPMSKLYEYKLVPNKGRAREIVSSGKYQGFFEARLDDGTEVLLGPDMEEVLYPESEDYKILEPFTHGEKIYFRIEDNETDWQPIPEEFCELWWKPLGGYAVIDLEGNEVIPFGLYQYIDQFVGGKTRVYCAEDEAYYIINLEGEKLKTYPKSDLVTPYKLYPDGYIYTRSDVDNKHSHALMTWDGEFIIPYYTYADDIFPKYLGEDTFLVNNDRLIDGSDSGLILYSRGKEPRKLPDNSYDVFSLESNKYVTGMIINGLAGPLAKWEYVVTDYEGNTLLQQGRYNFSLGGWGADYAVAKKGTKLVLLDKNCREVKLPDYMELTGRYAEDAALFIVKSTKDYQMWRFPEVPARYDNPVGIVDKDFNWVIPPGVIDYVRNLPIQSVHSFSEYKQGDSEKNSLLHIYAVSKE